MAHPQVEKHKNHRTPANGMRSHNATRRSRAGEVEGHAMDSDSSSVEEPKGSYEEENDIARRTSLNASVPDESSSLPRPQPYSRNGSGMSGNVHYNSHRKRTSLLDDCESGISMNCRCRKATLVTTLVVSVVVAFYSNISLVVKLGASDFYNRDNYLDDTPMLLSSNAAYEAFKHAGRKVNEDFGDDDDPLSATDDGMEEDEAVADYNTGETDTASDTTSGGTGGKKAMAAALKGMGKTNRGQRKQIINKMQMVMNTKNANVKGNKVARNPRKNPSSNAMEVQPSPEAMSPDATFSACLLIKDDNEILPEWIAYHYHTINLRHLIVAVDPLSTESPTSILANWKLNTDMQIRIWHDEHYMPEEFLILGRPPDEFIANEKDLKNKNYVNDSAVIAISNHRYRQRVFLASCMRAMRVEGNSWVMHIDTDEYVVPSKLLRQMKPRYLVIPPMDQPGSVLSLIQQVVNKTANSVKYPCISMLRVLFGSVESSLAEQSVGVPAEYNATAFESLRWRFHALPHHAELHGNPKVILDVRAIPERFFEPRIVFSIHRPVREYCPRHSEMAFSNFRKQPIAVNHYLGSWERYSGRNDLRRSRDKYDMKASVNRGHDDGIRLWLRGFVKGIGTAQATKLLGSYYLAQYDNDTAWENSPVVTVPDEIPRRPLLDERVSAQEDAERENDPDTEEEDPEKEKEEEEGDDTEHKEEEPDVEVERSRKVVEDGEDEEADEDREEGEADFVSSER